MTTKQRALALSGERRKQKAELCERLGQAESPETRLKSKPSGLEGWSKLLRVIPSGKAQNSPGENPN